jgi:hypothetical protein
VLTITLATLVLCSAPAVLNGDEEVDICTGDASLEVWVDGEPSSRCEPLFGGLDERADNAGWRAERLHQVIDKGETLDITHGDPKLTTPVLRSLPGMKVVGVRNVRVEEEDCTSDHDTSVAASREERVVELELDDRWQQACGVDRLLLRADDAIGANGRVLWIGPSGVLAHVGDALAWVPTPGADVPDFRMTWRSGFALDIDPSAKGKATKGKKNRSKKKRKPKKKKKKKPKKKKRKR